MNSQLIPILFFALLALARAEYNESLCSVCEEMVQEVQGAIQSDVSLELAGALMQDMCANSLEDVAPVCNFLVDGYLSSVMEITSTLAYELCPLLDLCQSYSPFQADGEKQLQLSECSLCQLGALEARHHHRKHPPSPPSPPLLALVAAHPQCQGDAEGCARAVSFLFSRLLEAGAWSPGCDGLDSCRDRGAGQKLPMGSKYCIFCKVIVNQAQGSLASMSTETFQGMLENVCEGLDGAGGVGKDDEDLEKQCEELKEKYASVMLQIIQKVSPASLCGMFNICSDSVQALQQYQPDVMDSNVCFMCQTVFSYLTELLQDGNIEGNIVSVIEKVCYTLPSGVSSQCYNFVSTYGAFLLSKMASMIGSKAVCNTIPGCYNQTEEWEIAPETKQLIRQVSVYEPEELARDNLEALTCSWCTYMVGQLQSVVNNQGGDNMKNRVFNSSCALLPSSFHNVDCGVCRERYEKTITSLLKDGVKPCDICQQHISCCRLNASRTLTRVSDEILSAYYWIGAEALAPFFSAPGHRHLLSKHKSKHPSPPPPPDQAQCMACEFLVASAFEEKHLHLPHAPGHDRRELRHACKEVPKGYKDMCEAASKKMAHTHFQKHKLHHGSPPKACAAVGQCKSKATGHLLLLPLESQNLLLYGMQDGINTCVLCKLVAGVIAVQLKAANLTINLVEYMVQTVCNMMQRDECWDVVDSLKTIIRKVGQYVDPADVCVNTGFCSSAGLPLLAPAEPRPRYPDLAA